MLEVSNNQYARNLRAEQGQQVQWPADRQQVAIDHALTRLWDEYGSGNRTAKQLLQFLGHHAPDVEVPEADAVRDNARERGL